MQPNADIIMLNTFLSACREGDEKKARELYENDKSVLNLKLFGVAGGLTGIAHAICHKQYHICRWLLSLPDIDVNMKCGPDGDCSALHIAVSVRLPLELMISVVRLASKETINMKCTIESPYIGLTALDIAIKKGEISTAIYLSWLGAQCKDENKKFGDVTLHTWLDAGRHQDAPMWAVAANEPKALRELAGMAEVTFDKSILLNIAKLFDRREIKCYLEDNPYLRIYTNQVFSDFEVTFKEFIFPCHKNFLANLSSHFQGIIEDKTRKNLPMKTELLNCPNESVAESFVKFFYIGTIDKDLLEWHTVSFLHLADYYRIKELQTIAENSMILQLCKENVKEFLIAADMYQSARVKAAAFDFLFKNRGTWSEEIEEWKPFISRELLCEIVIKLG